MGISRGGELVEAEATRHSVRSKVFSCGVRRSPLDLALITLVCVLCYHNTFSNEFIRDDIGVIVENDAVTQQLSLAEIFGTAYRGSTEDGLYRPLTVLTFALNHRLSGLSPVSYHVVNLVLHVLNSILLYLFLRRLLSGGHGLIGALLFAAHPVHTEAVTSIVGRAELLAAFFTLSALYIHSLRPADGSRRLAGGLLLPGLYLLGIFSKENVITLPLALVALDFHLGRFKWERTYFSRAYPALLVTGLACFGVRWMVLGGFGPDASTQYFSGESPLTVLFTMSEVHFQYLRLLIFPVHLHVDETYRTLVGGFVSTLTLETLFNLVILVAMGSLTAILFLKRSSAGLFLALFYVLLLTVMNIIPIGALMAERFLYLPSMCFAAIVDLLVLRLLPSRRAVLGALVAAVVCSYALIGLQRNLDWRDGISMGEIVVRNNPAAPEPRFDLGTYYFSASRFEESVEEFRAFNQLRPRDAKGYFALGHSLEKLGQTRRARAYYLEAIAADETFSDAYLNLGILHATEGDWRNAEGYLRKAIRHDPGNGLYHFNLGLLHEETGRADEAEREKQRARELGFG
ncbi:MAG: tetratricopeptide repeat protein [Planctomycetota bacterium]|nr:tetratricopeptide repeat protein [Planctomycetota bacterium]